MTSRLPDLSALGSPAGRPDPLWDTEDFGITVGLTLGALEEILSKQEPVLGLFPVSFSCFRSPGLMKWKRG